MVYGTWEVCATEFINRRTLAHCKCTICGENRDIRLDVLMSNPPYCKCSPKNTDYSGMRKSGFVIVSKNDDGTYLCKCDCGSTFTTTIAKIRRDINSCGCKKANPSSNIKERECRECGKKFEGGPRAWYCPQCRENRRAESKRKTAENRKNGTLKSPGKEMICENCGKTIIRNAANQRYCEECGKENIKEIARQQSLEYYENNKEEINVIRKGTRKKYDIVSLENPLDYDIVDAFINKYRENMGFLISKYTAKEIASVSGKSEKTVYNWASKNRKCLPTIKTLLILYKKYGDIALPYITHKGTLERKDKIQPLTDTKIAKLCAKSGYTEYQIAKIMNKNYVTFNQVYSKDNIGSYTAIELLYVFGIDDVLEFFG